MSYALAESLQAAVFARLSTSPALGALVGGAIFDTPPPGELPETYVTLGPETVRDASDREGAGAVHRFTVSVVSEAAGFATAKAVAAAVGDVLLHQAPAPNRGRLVGLWFERATVRRSGRAGRLRRIDLRFRARVEDNSAT